MYEQCTFSVENAPTMKLPVGKIDPTRRQTQMVCDGGDGGWHIRNAWNWNKNNKKISTENYISEEK